MKAHVEEGELVIRLDLTATFDPDYEGDDDGFAWLERFRREVQPELVASVFRALRRSKEFEALAAPRGKSPDRAVDIAVRFVGKPRAEGAA